MKLRTGSATKLRSKWKPWVCDASGKYGCE
jgi:hypothetical protein